MNVPAKVIVSLLSFSALASANAADFDDYGRVLRVTPHIEEINVPVQDCHTEYVPQPQSRSPGGAIIGGLAGGLIGNQIGGGNGRAAATAVGAVTGAIVGDRIDNDDRAGPDRPVRRCRTFDRWESQTTGYNVAYDYQGRTYSSVLPYDPGQRVRLHVSITPRP